MRVVAPLREEIRLLESSALADQKNVEYLQTKVGTLESAVDQ